MRTESLERLISSCDFQTFREVAHIFLNRRGFQQVELSDGWNDGGSDLRVYMLPPNPAKLAVQLTVDRKWPAKLRDDASKAKRTLGLERLFFLTSYRIDEVEFSSLADQILRDHGVHVSRYDAQSIASAFHNWGATDEILRICNIQTDPSSIQNNPPADARTLASDAFLIFSKDASDFRREILRSYILATSIPVTRRQNRKEVAEEVVTLLGLSQDGPRQVQSQIDRMLQEGALILEADGTLVPNKIIQSSLNTELHLQRQDELNLMRDVKAYIKSTTGRQRIADEDVMPVLDALGAAVLWVGRAAPAKKGTVNTRGTIGQIKARLSGLNAALDALGVSDGIDSRGKAIEHLTQIAAGSPHGKRLATAELYFNVARLNTSQIVNAFGGGRGVRIYLDASVAIPMLSALLYSPSSSRFSAAAHKLHQEAHRHNFRLFIPEDYIEESASHLIFAARDYRQIIDADPDLMGSENAFVSHFSYLRTQGRMTDFDRYIGGYGVSPERLAGARENDRFLIARAEAQSALRRMFARYNIEPFHLSKPSASAIRRAETALSYAQVNLDIQRPPILMKHDERMIAFLLDQDMEIQRAAVLCTWDRLHFEVASNWEAMTPVELSDIIELAVPGDENGPLSGMLAAASAITQEASEMGGRIWDALVRYHAGDLYDAELLSEAKKFKASFVERSRADVSYKAIADAWTNWKGERSTGPRQNDG